MRSGVGGRLPLHSRPTPDSLSTCLSTVLRPRFPMAIRRISVRISCLAFPSGRREAPRSVSGSIQQRFRFPQLALSAMLLAMLPEVRAPGKWTWVPQNASRSQKRLGWNSEPSFSTSSIIPNMGCHRRPSEFKVSAPSPRQSTQLPRSVQSEPERHARSSLRRRWRFDR